MPENTSNSGGAQKPTEDWTSGDDPVTPAQQSYLNTLAQQAGEQTPRAATKAEASEKIDELRSKSSPE